MARPNNTNVAPGGGGGGMPSRGAKVSSGVTVTVKPGAAGLSPKEVARLKAINNPPAKPSSKSIGTRFVGGIGGTAAEFINSLYK